MRTEYLFVYGTLRLEYGLELVEKIAAHVEYEGTGTVKASLYDLGDYPGAVKSEPEQSGIRGDVYRIHDAAIVFDLLDEYEGEEYQREKVTVTTGEGTGLEAWIYWYCGSIEGRLRIEENDYLDYLKNKKDRLV